MTVPVIYMLDTNTVSYILKGQSRMARKKLRDVSVDNEVCISSITEAEVRYGLEKRQVSHEFRTETERFLDVIDIESWGSAAAKKYGAMRARLDIAGKPLSSMDLLIAAHAVSLGATLVTNDHAFKNVQGLTLANWAVDLRM